MIPKMIEWCLYRLHWLVYGALIVLMLIGMFGCATTRLMRLPPPAYPLMERVLIEKDGTLSPSNVKKASINMLKLQELIDILYEAPCYEDNN